MWEAETQRVTVRCLNQQNKFLLQTYNLKVFKKIVQLRNKRTKIIKIKVCYYVREI